MTVNAKISDLPDAGALLSADVVPVMRVVSGVPTNYKMTIGNLIATAGFITPQTVTGTTHTLGSSDGNALIDLTNTAGCNVTIPHHSITNIPVGTQILVRCNNSAGGQCQFTAGNDGMGHNVTFNVKYNRTKMENAQYALAFLYHVSTDVWQITGDLSS